MFRDYIGGDFFLHDQVYNNNNDTGRETKSLDRRSRLDRFYRIGGGKSGGGMFFARAMAQRPPHFFLAPRSFQSPSRRGGTQHSPVDSVTLKINKGFTLDPAHPLPPSAPFSTSSSSSTSASYSPRLSQERIAGVDGSARLWWSDDQSFY